MPPQASNTEITLSKSASSQTLNVASSLQVAVYANQTLFVSLKAQLVAKEPVASMVVKGNVPSPTGVAFEHRSLAGALEMAVMQSSPDKSWLLKVRWTRTK